MRNINYNIIKTIDASNNQVVVILPNDYPTLLIFPENIESSEFSINGFRRGDKLIINSSLISSIADQSNFTDGKFTIQLASGGIVQKIKLSGLNTSDDNSIFSVEDFNLIFGEKSIGLALASLNSTDILGGDGSDYISGSISNDRILGLNESDFVTGNSGNDVLYGGVGNDTILGGNGQDSIYGGSNNDEIFGGDLIDNIYFTGKFNEYSILRNQSFTVVTDNLFNRDGVDYIFESERFNFSNYSIAFDLNGNAGLTAKLIGAVFGKDSITNKKYMGIGLSLFDADWSYENIVNLALDAAGVKTNDQIVELLWTNVIGTPASNSDKAPFVNLLLNGMPVGELVRLASDSSFNISNINLMGLTQNGVEYLPFT